LKNAHFTKKLKSTAELIDALNIEHRKSNELRREKGLREINTIFLGKYRYSDSYVHET
jgi:hypothetical protein